MRIDINDKNNFMVMFNQIFPNNNMDIVNGLSIDSREIKENDLFVSIKGEKYDGHNYIDNVLKIKGTICISEKNNTKNNNRILRTKSTKEFLLELAKNWTKKSNSKIIAVTGSNGKTTIKELLYHILKKKFNCGKSVGNHNSTIGLPVSYLNCNLDNDYNIIEMGANKPGEIEKLCHYLKPTYSIITNISNAHIENFKSINEIAETKSAIFRNIKKNGICFLNADDKYISKMKVQNSIRFGKNDDADFKYIIKSNNKIEIKNKIIHIPDSLIHVKESIIGVYTIASTIGIKTTNFNEGLKTFKIPNGRGNIFTFKNYKIIDDSYNANPASMKKGLIRFSSMNSLNQKIIIIADMLELGDKKVLEHKKIGEQINLLNINIVLTYGKLAKHIHNQINEKNKQKKHFNNFDLLKKYFLKTVKKNDLVFLKGSRSMQIERIYK